MFQLLLVLLAGLFAAMLFVNVYFRVKVFQTYKRLVDNRVEFTAAHIFNKKKMAAEVLPRHPNMKADIEAFSRHMSFSLKLAALLVAATAAIGAVLLYFR